MQCVRRAHRLAAVSYQVRILTALQSAETLAAAGRDVRYCLDQAATLHAVSRGELAARWLSKVIEGLRARAALAQLQEGDDA